MGEEQDDGNRRQDDRQERRDPDPAEGAHLGLPLSPCMAPVYSPPRAAARRRGALYFSSFTGAGSLRRNSTSTQPPFSAGVVTSAKSPPLPMSITR